jgi:ribonucleoside-diphosphate reductase alpha chain
MWSHREEFNGIAVLPYEGGTYQQLPFEDITEEKFLEMYSHLEGLDLTKVHEETDNTDLAGEIACSASGCEVT